jgi:hypothetical protein
MPIGQMWILFLTMGKDLKRKYKIKNTPGIQKNKRNKRLFLPVQTP